MDYYGLLFLYYLKGLSGKSILRLFFNIEAGGTEQLLPENTSTPTTTPILADIQYPDGLRTDQYFTYRETPTTVSNKARIKTIKGNTLNWNQIYNVNSDRTNIGVNIKVVNGAVSITGTSTNVGTGPAFAWTDFKAVLGHKYIITKDFTLPSGDYIFDQYNLNSSTDITTVIFTVTNSGEYIIPQLKIAQADVTYNINGHLCVYDLTKMFGAGNEPTTVEEFKSLFPLSYYSYNQGSLLSFNGNGIKTVGKNQVANIVRGYFSVGVGVINVDNDSESVVFYAIKGKTYVSSSAVTLNRNVIARCDTPNLVHGSPIYDIVNTSRTWTATWTGWTVWYVYSSRNETVENSAQVEFGTTATAYEPYTESVLNLPISTYFPSGMKDVPDYTNGGKIYDEMTSNKADTRVGSVDLGTLNWTTYSSPERHVFRAQILSNMKQPNDANLPNAMCSRYEPMAYNPISANDDGYFAIGAQRIVIIEHDYTDPVAFKESLSNVYLYYELATPTETPITTEDANEALSLLMGKSVSSNNANQLINIITKGE